MDILKAHCIIRDAVKEEDRDRRHAMVHKAMTLLRNGGHI